MADHFKKKKIVSVKLKHETSKNEIRYAIHIDFCVSFSAHGDKSQSPGQIRRPAERKRGSGERTGSCEITEICMLVIYRAGDVDRAGFRASNRAICRSRTSKKRTNASRRS